MSTALIASSSLLASATLDLTEVPWTDAAHFWTWNGRRLPAKNKNLMGNKISIAGTKYEKGIAGHTGFSVVYNLSGEALKFTAIAGVDDEEYKRDPENKDGSFVKIIILVDRKEAFRKIVAWKDKGIPVSIDLKGKQQMELRGEYGKSGFHRQRPVFANPELEVKNKKSFLNTAKEWHKKIEDEKKLCPKYPPAPKWKNFKIERKAYKGWENAYWISNGKIETIILPEFGGRIMSFKLKNGENILTENGKYKKSDLMKRGGDFINGGHFTRPQPRNYFIPCDPALLFSKYSIEFPAEGEILLTSPKSWMFWLQYKFIIKMSKDKPELEITNINKNIAPFPNMAGIWSITRVKSSLATAIIMPDEMKNPPAKHIFSPSNYYTLVKKDKKWLRLDLTDKLWKSLGKKGSIGWEEYPSINQIKVLFSGTTFIKSFDYTPSEDNEFMGKFYPAHFYVNKLFIEVECHGPTKNIAPGKEIELKEKWQLLK